MGREVGEIGSDDEEEEASHIIPVAADKSHMNNEERRQLAEKKRSVRRKTHSPKRVQKSSEILDERYAASLLEYYSKHKPYYGVDPETARQLEAEAAKVDCVSITCADLFDMKMKRCCLLCKKVCN